MPNDRNTYRSTPQPSDKKRMRDIADAVSSKLAKLAILLLIAVVLSQIALQNDGIRRWISDVDRWEGTAPD
ncbi:hypothetical protein [Paenibacillus sp. NEAU-GSW1]|uniref:hypothetical protein n=1 Tax=Paenibacillus sp. NEAU-GSW1 TaxID=2682486 RepID=UPI0012E2C79D|nr:hypothetical protein [Paenibacillus sp. NEAU-GSW1]MUT65505.1 hypothetical protein [Paenibacillus sp. NEAU-GSW1]